MSRGRHGQQRMPADFGGAERQGDAEGRPQAINQRPSPNLEAEWKPAEYNQSKGCLCGGQQTPSAFSPHPLAVSSREPG